MTARRPQFPPERRMSKARLGVLRKLDDIPQVRLEFGVVNVLPLFPGIGLSRDRRVSFSPVAHVMQMHHATYLSHLIHAVC